MCIILVITSNCKKEEKELTPTLKTLDITEITSNSASCGGDISSDGGAAIIAKGVCWSTTQMPTITDSKTSDGVSLGSYTSSITGLTAGTTYYVRSYAINSAGTAYGNEINFTTIPTSISDIDGNSYHTIIIGNQVWLAENLKTTKYRDGTSITNIIDNTSWSNSTTGAYCYYDNDISYANDYGALYNFYAIADSRNICPAGWHIPSDNEWTTLTTFLGGESEAGAKLKEVGNDHWDYPNSGTNSSGFAALPGGERYNNGTFHGSHMLGIWWTSTTYYNAVWMRHVSNNGSQLFRSIDNKEFGFSVRCIKD